MKLAVAVVISANDMHPRLWYTQAPGKGVAPPRALCVPGVQVSQFCTLRACFVLRLSPAAPSPCLDQPGACASLRARERGGSSPGLGTAGPSPGALAAPSALGNIWHSPPSRGGFPSTRSGCPSAEALPPRNLARLSPCACPNGCLGAPCLGHLHRQGLALHVWAHQADRIPPSIYAH